MRLAASLAMFAVMFAVSALAQGPAFKMGRAPTEAELKEMDIAIGPEGKELPPGSGAAGDGARIFVARRCEMCHGPNAKEGPAPALVGGGIAGWSFATSIWDYIHRAMPLNQEGWLSPDEVYALTAFLLWKNNIIKEGDVMNAQTLPQVQMPNRKRYVTPPVDQWQPGMRRPFKLQQAKPESGSGM